MRKPARAFIPPSPPYPALACHSLRTAIESPPDTGVDVEERGSLRTVPNDRNPGVSPGQWPRLGPGGTSPYVNRVTAKVAGVTATACPHDHARRIVVRHHSPIALLDPTLCLMTQGLLAPFDASLAPIREVFAQHRQTPSELVGSPELQCYTRDASRVAVTAGMPFVAACAEFGRAAAESFPSDRLVAIRIGRAMTRWAAEVYQRPSVVDTTVL